ncbi:glycosyltransferase family 4 protein [Aliidiomarina maris]|nr:glycosyltransferase family 4 protein [Aliidiomarina maris]RUO19080.1 hypothetical protein CWE07_13300 [Aliidiomarina maris]
MLLISNIFPTEENPHSGIFVKRFFDGFLERGYEVDVVTKYSGSRMSLAKKISYSISYIYDCYKAIQNFEGDIIYVHYLSYNLIPFYFLSPKCKLVLNAHGGDIIPMSLFSRLIKRIVAPILRKADLVVVPSLFLKTKVRTEYQINNCKLFISPSGGVDIDLFSPKQEKELDFSRPIVLGFVSRLEDGKGWETLLSAVKYYEQESPGRIKVEVYGEGRDLNTFLEKVESLSLKNVISWKGRADPKDVPAIMRRFDCFVFPTHREESLGLVGLEALATGLPILASRIGAVPEYVHDYYNGFLFEAGNSQQLKLAIAAIVNSSQEQILFMQKNARNKSVYYNALDCAEQLSSRIDLLIEDSSKERLC